MRKKIINGVSITRAEYRKFTKWVRTTHPNAPVKARNTLFSHWREGVESGLY